MLASVISPAAKVRSCRVTVETIRSRRSVGGLGIVPDCLDSQIISVGRWYASVKPFPRSEHLTSLKPPFSLIRRYGDDPGRYALASRPLGARRLQRAGPRL